MHKYESISKGEAANSTYHNEWTENSEWIKLGRGVRMYAYIHNST
jgi:hypothetical protein